MNNPKVSIIIVNYNSSRLLAGCIKSIMQHTKDLDFEIIVVDNNSEPYLSCLIAQKFGHTPRIRVIQLSQNIGFGAANNYAIGMAAGEYLFFLNPDTLLCNNAIKELSDFLDNNPSTGACGGNLYNNAMMPAFSYRKFLPGIIHELDELSNNLISGIFFRGNSFHNLSGKPIKTGFISGADLMVRKKVLEKTGSFNKKFFLYFEETDLCRRIKKCGMMIHNVPKAKIIHMEGGSIKNSLSNNDLKIKTMEQSRRIYYNLNANKINRIVCDLIYLTFLLSRIFLIRDKPKKKSYLRHLHYFRQNYRLR